VSGLLWDAFSVSGILLGVAFMLVSSFKLFGGLSSDWFPENPVPEGLVSGRIRRDSLMH
jgi:hypothetical protein